MLNRHIEPTIKKYAKEYPILAVVGPRQSGKTTLVKKLFPKHHYLSLENLDLRRQAEDDPRGFLADFGNKLILDEIQRVPSLFSYLQELVDTNQTPGQYVLTGSQQFLLMENISQSLAGRICYFKLFPFTYRELTQQSPDKDLDSIITPKKQAEINPPALNKLLLNGFYPRIHDKHLSASKWLENYVLTYLERDIRSLIDIKSLRLFEDFIKILAAYSGQLVNYAAISNLIGISQPTIKKWISLLETSGVIFILSQYYRNYSKRIVKTPKIYFIDTGLLCFLLSIYSEEQLKAHPNYGNIFESFIISDLYKRIHHTGHTPPLFFWRDKTGNEIDLLVDLGSYQLPIEIKSSKTFSASFKKSISYWFTLKGNANTKGLILYNGVQPLGSTSDIRAYPWWLL
ncbi:ATP-binding protein [bacterium]|nr:ATP-binding protein [bacterium]